MYGYFNLPKPLKPLTPQPHMQKLTLLLLFLSSFLTVGQDHQVNEYQLRGKMIHEVVLPPPCGVLASAVVIELEIIEFSNEGYPIDSVPVIFTCPDFKGEGYFEVGSIYQLTVTDSNTAGFGWGIYNKYILENYPLEKRLWVDKAVKEGEPAQKAIPFSEYNKITIIPEVWNQYSFGYSISREETSITQMHFDGEITQLESVENFHKADKFFKYDLETFETYYNNVCGVDDGEDMIVQFWNHDTIVKEVRLYEAYEARIESLVLYINNKLEQRYGVPYDMQAHKESMENCNMMELFNNQNEEERD